MGASILALQTVQTALKGGSTHVASVWKLYNELAVSHPHALEALFEPTWPIQVYVCLLHNTITLAVHNAKASHPADSFLVWLIVLGKALSTYSRRL